MSATVCATVHGSPGGRAGVAGPDVIPLGFRVMLGPDTRLHPCPDGGVVLGGSPLRVLRLNGAAWRELTGLAAGREVAGPAAARVAARLVDAGVAEPVPPVGGPDAGAVTVVIPVRDRAEALARCLAAVGPAAAVLVVDDASVRPAAIASTATAAGARLIRRRVNGGPAAARNTGLAAAGTPLVAFVDSDCVPEPGWLAPLLRHFADPAVAAVAPRIVGFGSPLAGWASTNSSARAWTWAHVRAGSRRWPASPTLPAAALVVRRSALGAGFDERLRLGEDVDLLWRLHSEGRRVRYEPAARVRHDHRVAFAEWARRRYDYGTSAGQLARRHPGHVPPAVTSVVALAPLVLAARRRHLAAAAFAALGAVGLARRLPPFPGREREAARLMAAGMATTALGVSRAATRAWLPLTLVLVLAPGRRGVRLTVGAAVLAHPLAGWVRRRPSLDPLRWSAACLLDDAAYCAGLWVGAVRARTAGPLLPAVPEWPSRRKAHAGHPARTFAGDRTADAARTGAGAPARREGIPV